MAAISQTELASSLQEEAIKEADEAADEYVEADEDEDDDDEEEEIEYLDEDEVNLGEVPVLPLHRDDLAHKSSCFLASFHMVRSLCSDQQVKAFQSGPAA